MEATNAPHAISTSTPRWTPRAAAFAAGAVLAVVLGALALTTPYERAIDGTRDGATVVINSACRVPLVSMLNDASRQVDGNGDWMSDQPPCQRSARYRVTLGGILLVTAAGLWYGARVLRREAPPRR